MKTASLILALLLSCVEFTWGQVNLKLLKTVNPVIGQFSTGPTTIATANGIVYYDGVDDVAGTELWRTDGTAAGTYQVKDINPGGGSSGIASLAVLNNTLYFFANDGTNGPALWKSDGTAQGTVMVKLFSTGAADGLIAVNGRLLFEASSPDTGMELWQTDGTSNGTSLVLDINPGPSSSIGIANSIVMGSVLYFAADDGTHGTELWKTDGTTAGTSMVKDIVTTSPGPPSSSPRNLVVNNGTLYFIGYDNTVQTRLYKSDGTAAGTLMISLGSVIPVEIQAANGTLYIIGSNFNYQLLKLNAVGTPQAVKTFEGDVTNLTSKPSLMVAFKNKLFFAGWDSSHGNEIWSSDGTPAGTTMFVDLVAGTAGGLGVGVTGHAPSFSVVGTRMYFFGMDTNSSLWVTDGTVVGTVALSSTRYPGDPYAWTSVGSEFFTITSGGGPAPELWKSDGTAAGTQAVSHPLHHNTSNIGPAVTYKGKSYFSADDGVHGQELWITDGTPGGTVLFKDLNPGTDSGSPTELTVMGNALYFFARDALKGNELWRSDGTTIGTFRLTDVTNGADPTLFNMYNLGGTLFFNTLDANTDNRELWVSDGTMAGSYAMTITLSGGPVSVKSIQSSSATVVYFLASTPATGAELWATDGSPGGTVFLGDINTGPADVAPVFLGQFDGETYFSAQDPTHGTELWKTDGTADGTTLVKDICAGTCNSSPFFPSVIGSTLYFTAYDVANGYSVWTSDGSASGTTMLFHPQTGDGGPLNYAGEPGKIFFEAMKLSNGGLTYVGTDLYLTDGMTTPVLVTSYYNSRAKSFTVSPAYFNGMYYFYATESSTGSELWKSDGTAAGTMIVKDVFTGPTSSTPGNIQVINGSLYFRAVDGPAGAQIWKIKDPCGAQKITAANGNVVSQYLLGTRMIVRVNDYQYGDALFYYDLTEETAVRCPDEQSITFDPLVTKHYGDPPYALTATASSGLAVSYQSSNLSVATVSGSTLTITGVGTATITAKQDGDFDFNAAAPVTQVLTVEKGTQQITFSTIPNKIANDPDFAILVTANSGLPLTFTVTPTGLITLVGSQVHILNPGRVTIEAEQAGSANYLSADTTTSFCIAPTRPTLTITRAGQIVTLESNHDTGNQWYKDGTAVSGASGKKYVLPGYGVYSVTTQVDDCVSQASVNYTYAITGLSGSSGGVEVYPNPATNEINVIQESHEACTVSVINTVGVLVLEGRASDGNFKLDTSNLPAGLYVLRIVSAGGEESVRVRIERW